MNFQWAQSNKLLLVVVASAVAIDGVLTALVLHQQHNHSTITGQVTRPPAAPGTPAARSSSTRRSTATDSRTTGATTPLTSAPLVSTPRIITPPQHPKAKISPHRQVHPMPASPPPPQTNPAKPGSSDTLVKPGAPPEISNPGTSTRYDASVKPGAPPEVS
jgi:hypothetical protein